MVLSFTTTFSEALTKIQLLQTQQFSVHNTAEIRSWHNSDEIVEKYVLAKWQIVDVLNQEYSHLLETPFDLHNWLNHNHTDEVAYFLSEAGSNVLNYSEFKAPKHFQVWLGKNGFIIGIEQQGTSFNPRQIHTQLIKENEGSAFTFFRTCRSEIFFDSVETARTIYFLYLFSETIL